MANPLKRKPSTPTEDLQQNTNAERQWTPGPAQPTVNPGAGPAPQVISFAETHGGQVHPNLAASYTQTTDPVASDYAKLLEAVGTNNADLVKQQLDTGLDPNYKVHTGETLIDMAFRLGHIDVAKQFLIKLGEQTFKKTYPPICICSYLGNIDHVEQLLTNGANIEDSGADSKVTPLLFAAARGHLPLVKHLISKGANLQATAVGGANAMLLAALNGKLDVVKYFIKVQGFDINATDIHGYTALDLVLVKKHSELIGWLLYKGARSNIYKIAGVKKASTKPASEEIPQTNKPPIANQSPPSLPSSSSSSSTSSLAPISSTVPQVRPLRPLQQTVNRETLKQTFEAGNVLLVVQILESFYGHLRNPGESLICYFTRTGEIDFIGYLLKAGVNIEARDLSGNTPLLAAVGWGAGKLQTVQFLVDNGANPHTTEGYGRNALMIAASWGHLEVVKYFIEQCHMDPQMKDSLGQTARDHALNLGYQNVVQYLSEISKSPGPHFRLPMAPSTPQPVSLGSTSSSSLPSFVSPVPNAISSQNPLHSYAPPAPFVLPSASQTTRPAPMPIPQVKLIKPISPPKTPVQSAAEVLHTLVEAIHLKQPVSAEQFNEFLDKAQQNWSSKKEVGKFLGALNVLLPYLNAKPASYQRQPKTLTSEAFARAAIKALSEFRKTIVQRRNEPNFEWNSSAEFSRFIEGHLKNNFSTPQDFLKIFNSAYPKIQDPLKVYTVLESQMVLERLQEHQLKERSIEDYLNYLNGQAPDNDAVLT